MIHEFCVEEKTMQTHPSKDTSCVEGFDFNMASAVDSWKARFPISSQAHLRVSGFGDLSNRGMWSSAFAPTIPFAPSSHCTISDNVYVSRKFSLTIHEFCVEEKTMQTHPSKDTSCTEGFNFKMAGAMDLWLVSRPTNSQAHF
jgi:hypothetical protein